MRFLFTFFGLLALATGVHLYTLFFPFGSHLSAKQFAHGFSQEYAQEVDGLNPVLLDSIFAQKFSFLGQGKQMTAFVSEDGHYVLKLFNPRAPLKQGWAKQSKFWRRYSSAKWLSKQWLQKSIRLEKLFLRHKIAFEKIPTETGLVFVHLSPSKRVCHYVHVTDKKGKEHVIATNKTPFVLQRKAELVPAYLHRQIEHKGLDGAISAIQKLESLFDKRLEFGITDRIQTMENNYGFVGDQPIQLDVGRIRIEEHLIEEPQLEKARILENFHQWVKQGFPELMEN